jgi:hypothetical protein
METIKPAIDRSKITPAKPSNDVEMISTETKLLPSGVMQITPRKPKPKKRPPRSSNSNEWAAKLSPEFRLHVEKILEGLHAEKIKARPFKMRPPKPDEFQLAHTTFDFATFLKSYKISDDGAVRANQPAVMNPFELMYIYSDIVKPEPFDNMLVAMLEIIKTEGTQGNLTQYRASSNIQYKTLDRPNISNIRILIASDQAQPIPFMRGPLVITLHFRRRPIYH